MNRKVYHWVVGITIVLGLSLIYSFLTIGNKAVERAVLKYVYA